MADDIPPVPPVPPVPGVPHPEDVRARNERIANAECPTCGERRAVSDVGSFNLQQGFGLSVPVRADACMGCGRLTFFL